jgi:antirestriction protein ArdC
MTSSIREQASGRIVDALRRGLIPWRTPWTGLANTGLPANVVTEQPYLGVSRLLLILAAQERGFTSRWWGRKKDWQALGRKLKRRPQAVPAGQWATRIVAGARVAAVFNAHQVEGADQYLAGEPVHADYGRADKVVQATGARICHRHGHQALYFYPPRDSILLPLRCQFEEGPGGLPGYYEAVFHELAHWTERRLGWKNSYVVNELRADLAATHLAASLGIPVVSDKSLLMNHAHFAGQWIGAMQADPGLIFRICAGADAAVAFVLNPKSTLKQQATGQVNHKTVLFIHLIPR